MIFFCRIVCRFQNYAYLCNRNRETKIDAEIAQLVEHNLAKVGVASSSLVFRSINRWNQSGSVRYQLPKWRNGRRARFRCEWLTAVQVRVLFWALILKANFWHAGEMAELVDALLWGGSGNYAVWVRVSFSSRFAEIAQLVEHNLAKVGVASSSLVFRSSEEVYWKDSLPFFCIQTALYLQGSSYVPSFPTQLIFHLWNYYYQLSCARWRIAVYALVYLYGRLFKSQ